MRLSQTGYDIGLLPERNYRIFCQKRDAVAAELNRLATTRVGTDLLETILRRPEVRYGDLPSRNDHLAPEVVEQVEIEVKYEGYIDRQELEVQKFKNLESKQIPEYFDYAQVPSLRSEARLKLQKIRPQTLGQASRISGVSPADIAILMVWLKRGQTATVSH
jgi:tRNA uridine 5-carboxymethylaminomethyl modification enzyme